MQRPNLGGILLAESLFQIALINAIGKSWIIITIRGLMLPRLLIINLLP